MSLAGMPSSLSGNAVSLSGMGLPLSGEQLPLPGTGLPFRRMELPISGRALRLDENGLSFCEVARFTVELPNKKPLSGPLVLKNRPLAPSVTPMKKERTAGGALLSPAFRWHSGAPTEDRTYAANRTAVEAFHPAWAPRC